jgi:hypothetical protein
MQLTEATLLWLSLWPLAAVPVMHKGNMMPQAQMDKSGLDLHGDPLPPGASCS